MLVNLAHDADYVINGGNNGIYVWFYDLIFLGKKP